MKEFKMKKILLVVGLLTIAVLTLGVAGFAYAQNQTPPAPEYPFGSGMMGSYNGYGRGMMGGRGGGMMGWNGEYGPMHDTMVAALADKLGTSVGEIENRLDSGENMWQIAESAGLSAEEIQALMLSAHDLALEEAVANGLLSEEQSEWMDEHMEQMWNGESGFGGHCGGWGNNSGWQGEN
jgi:hypothetical protein